MRCQKCEGDVEPIRRLGQVPFLFCRACKLAYNESGGLCVDTRTLSTSFNPLAIARGIIKETAGDAAAVARTALEVLLIQGLQEAYFSGLKDGVLLAYSQDVKGMPDEPVSGVAGSAGQSQAKQ